MTRFPVVSMALLLGAIPAAAQSMEDLNIQIHGYATQGFAYTTQNNWNSMNTSDGSPAWTEAVFNMTAQPSPKLRVGAQARYFLLGQSFGNVITLDWASGDYKFNERLGVRFGKVKTPSGMLNDTQDIAPAFLWSLLPQSIYPITSRNSLLADYGGLVYGSTPRSRQLGKLEYQFYAGERVIPENDGFFVPIQEAGVYYPNGLSGPNLGARVRWNLPAVDGLMLGAALDREDEVGQITIPSAGFSGNTINAPFDIPFFFGKYEHNRFMIGGEYSRVAIDTKAVFTASTGYPYPAGVQNSFLDHRANYAMASYKFTKKLTAGMYYSSLFDRKIAPGPARYQKDWTLSARYDFNDYVYFKAEQHFIDGTNLGYFTVDNTSLKPDTRLTILKAGVSF